MAILIPSKNIYDKDNPKVRANIVDDVSVEQTIVKPFNDYGVPVYNETVLILQTNKWKQEKTDVGTYFNGSNQYGCAISYTRIMPAYYYIPAIIPVLMGNSFIKDLILGLDKDGNQNIRYQIYGEFIKGNATATATQKGLTEDSITISNVVESVPTEKTEGIITLPSSTIYENEIKYGGGLATANAKIELNDRSTSGTVTQPPISMDGGKEVYRLQINYLCGIDILKLGGSNIYTFGGADVITEVTGTYEKYIPKQIEVTIYGNTIGISLEDGSVTYGSGNNPFSLSGNELLQDSATIGAKSISQHLADNVLSHYQNGKETATLLCDISDYYNYDINSPNLKGSKAISISGENKKPMTFEISDQVMPMIFGADGKDKYMSLKNDGTPKTFIVVGRDILYDGAVWQKLYLQEF